MNRLVPPNCQNIPTIDAPHQALPKVRSLSQRTLLQVEDNPANAELVEQMISTRSDLKLLTASDGHRGIEMACCYQPDVILMDMKMPGMDGYDTFIILRENSVTTHIPVIALSSNAFKSEIKRCLDAGFFRYVTKPFHIDEVMALIDVALQYAAENRPTK